MAFLGRLLTRAATRLYRDPRIRAKAAEVLEHEIIPRVEATWRETKPKIAAARDELRDIAETTNPREKPREFAAKVRERFIDRKPRS